MSTRERLIARRKLRGYTQESLARELGVTTGAVYKWEQGTSTPTARHRVPLADKLDWSPEQLALALDGEERSSNGHEVPQWLNLYASLEMTAAEACAWQPFTVHALLQTAEYATAVESVGPAPMAPDAVTRRVELRLSRQLAVARGLRLSVVLDESVLLRRTGGRDVMADQLDYLATAMRLPNVDIRVLPLDAGVHSAAFGAFTTLARPDDPGPFLAAVEDRTGHRLYENTDAVEAHSQLFDHLHTHALDPDETLDRILSRGKEYR